MWEGGAGIGRRNKGLYGQQRDLTENGYEQGPHNEPPLRSEAFVSSILYPNMNHVEALIVVALGGI